VFEHQVFEAVQYSPCICETARQYCVRPKVRASLRAANCGHRESRGTARTQAYDAAKLYPPFGKLEGELPASTHVPCLRTALASRKKSKLARVGRGYLKSNKPARSSNGQEETQRTRDCWNHCLRLIRGQQQAVLCADSRLSIGFRILLFRMK
jgi:hypothetical protein